MRSVAVAREAAPHWGAALPAFDPNSRACARRCRMAGEHPRIENVIERALILSSGTTLVLYDLVDLHPAAPADASVIKPTGLTLEEAERHPISAMLEETYWQIEGRDGAAQRRNINAGTLGSRMRRLGIERPRAQDAAAGGRRT